MRGKDQNQGLENAAVVNRRKNQLKRNRLLVVLGCVVVLMTAFALMVPAISITKDVAEQTEGIDLQATPDADELQSVETPASEEPDGSSDDQGAPEADAPAPEQPAASEPSDNSGDQGSASADSGDSSSAAASDEKSDSSAAADKDDSKDSADKDDSKDSADKDEADRPAQDFKGEVLDGEGNVVMTVIVKSPKGAFPAGTEMKIEALDADSVADKVETAIQDDPAIDGTVKSMTAIDIRFIDKKGKEIEPAKNVEVRITSGTVAEIESPVLVHVVDKSKDSAKGKTADAEVVKKVDVVDEQATDDTLKFKTNEFSPYVIVEMENLTTQVITAAGETYNVTVSYAPEANIPEGAELVVTEIVEGDDAYAGYLDQVNGELGSEVGFARFFDITIMSDGEPVQPAVPVSVSIELAGATELSDGVQAVHFADEGGVEVLDASLQGETVNFTAESFSVYAVVDGSTGNEARMTVEFYSGETKIATMYVKNSDTGTQLERILYDPGAGTLDESEVFIGWILDNAEYTTADVSSAMTIAQVREWAESLSIKEGDYHRFDAAVCRLYTITYKDIDQNGTVLGMDAVPVKSSEYGTAEVAHTINMAYTPPDEEHNFEGWTLDDSAVGNVTSDIPQDRIYQNTNPITIKGDISFTVNAPEGKWLVFNENGKGSTYNAPQFVKSGEVTRRPRPDNEMIRNGYTFGGWYAGVVGEPDEHGYTRVDESKPFTFGGELTEKTNIYAKWIPNATAPYTIVFWEQNLDRTGHDVKATYVGSGRVGENIPYTFRDNVDEDYLIVAGSDYHYTGFCAKRPEKDVKITPEGDAVLNVYYDRITYNLRFYLYRKGAGNNSYQYAQNSNAGRNVWGIATWYNGTSSNNMPTTTYGPILSESNVDGYTGYYFVLTAYYGEDISSKWPQYSQINGPANNRSPVSYIMMNGTGLKGNSVSGNGYGDGRDTIKGLITVMDEKILGVTNNANGNYLVVRFNTYNNWRYHIWYETVDGEDYTGKTTHTWNGKTYYESDGSPLEVRSSNTDVDQQNPPQYSGYEYVGRRNDTWTGDNRWTTGNNPTQYHINYVYNRLSYPINYMDGTYFDGNDNIVQSSTNRNLHTSAAIAQGATIPDECKNYRPDLPAGEAGYVFEGWYVDAGCTTPYTFSKMPIGGITVYAKWRQVQYRVFLHPNAGTDPNLDWGSENVSTSFRVTYGAKVSTPTGTRTGSGYEFVGWYTDPAFSSGSLYNAETELNDLTVTRAYDQTEDTELDKWGNVKSGKEGYNADAVEGRFWITKKLDLYAKWRKILEGADGINVNYTAEDDDGNIGTNAPNDKATYPDKAQAIAQAAATAPEGYEFKYWVVQKWDADQNKYVDAEGIDPILPGEPYLIDVELAHKESVQGETDKFTYTMQLRAEYSEPESGAPTHIWWFNNYSEVESATRHESAREDEGIQVNEAVEVLTAPTREGYVFLGWARVSSATSESSAGSQPEDKPTGKILENLTADDLYLKYENDQFVLNDPTSQYNGRVVTGVAADEVTPYQDMYAVWKKVHKVKVQKQLQGASTVSSQGFVFTTSLNGRSNTISPSDGAVEVGKVKSGDLVTITEAPVENFELVSVSYRVDGTSEEHALTPSGGAVTINNVTADIIVTFTNKAKVFPIDIAKADNDGIALKGSKFNLLWKKGTKIEGGVEVDDYEFLCEVDLSASSKASIEGGLAAGDYKLVETVVPSGYVIIGDDEYVGFKVKDNGEVVITYTATVTESHGAVVNQGTASQATGTAPATITIRNQPGHALPSTGGPGTAALTVIGVAMIVVAAIMLITRRRPAAARSCAQARPSLKRGGR